MAAGFFNYYSYCTIPTPHDRATTLTWTGQNAPDPTQQDFPAARIAPNIQVPETDASSVQANRSKPQEAGKRRPSPTTTPHHRRTDSLPPFPNSDRHLSVRARHRPSCDPANRVLPAPSNSVHRASTSSTPNFFPVFFPRSVAFHC